MFNNFINLLISIKSTVNTKNTSAFITIFIYSSMIANEYYFHQLVNSQKYPPIHDCMSNVIGIWIILVFVRIWTNRWWGKIFAFMIACSASHYILKMQSMRLVCAYALDITYYNMQLDRIYFLQNIAIIYFCFYFGIQIIKFNVKVVNRYQNNSN